jgi:hypothetical protein
MTTALILYTDGEIREIDVDPERPDVLAAYLDSQMVDPVRIHSGAVLLVDRYSTRDVAPLNMYASLLIFAARPGPFHGINGTTILFGLDADGQWSDVPDELLDLFRTLDSIVADSIVVDAESPP